MPKEKTVFFVIVTWNGKDYTIPCLESVKTVDYRAVRVIVIDNASVDGSAEVINNLFPDTILIKNTENLGYAEGNNIGIRHALKDGADYIFILNNDTVIGENTVRVMVDAMEKSSDIALASPVILDYEKKDFRQHGGGYVDPDTGYPSDLSHDKPYNYLCGSALMMRASTINKIGIFDDRFFIYCEDLDLSMRCVEKGYKLAVIDNTAVWHKRNVSFGGSSSIPYLYYMTRNRRLFCEKRKRRSLIWLLSKFIIPNLRTYISFVRRDKYAEACVISKAIYDGCLMNYGRMEHSPVRDVTVSSITGTIFFIRRHIVRPVRKAVKKITKQGIDE